MTDPGPSRSRLRLVAAPGASRPPALATRAQKPATGQQALPASRPPRSPQVWGWYGLVTVLIVVFDVYQFMRSGPGARYPYAGQLAHPVLVSLDSTVGWFFFLSAFLLGLPYARAALDGTPLRHGREVLYRRAIRLLPLYVVTVLIVWTLRNRSFPGDWRDLLEHLTFTQVFDDTRIFFTIGPAWALAVEVQFCVLLVLAAPALCRRCRRKAARAQRVRLLVTGVCIAVGLSIAWKVLAHLVFGVAESTWWVWFGLLAKADIFAGGLLLAVAFVALEPGTAVSRRTRTRLGAGGGALLVAAVLARAWTGLPAYVYLHTVVAAGFGLIVAATVLSRPPHARAGGAPRHTTRWGSALGVTFALTSYSLYLWHEPVMLFLATHRLYPTPGSAHAFPIGLLVLLPVATVVAWAAYWLIAYPTGMLGRTREASGRSRDYYRGD